MKNTFIKHFLVIASGTAVNMLIGFFTTPVITRLVDPASYGRFSLFTLYSGIGVMFLSLGLDQALVRYYYLEDTIDFKQSLLLQCTWLPVFCCIVGSFFFLLVTAFIHISIDFSLFTYTLLALNILFNLLYRFGLLVVRLEFNSKLFAILNILQKTIYLCVAFLSILIVKDYYFECLVIATIMAVFFCMLFSIKANKKIWVFPFHTNTSCIIDLKQLLKFAIPLMVATGVSSLFNAVDQLSLNYYCTYTEVGIYSSALTLSNVFAIVQTTINNIWGPTVIQHYSQSPEDKTLYQKGNQWVTVIMFLMGLTLILFKDYFSYLLGEKYREAAFIFPFLVFHPIMYTVSETTQIGITFMKKTGYQLAVAIFSCMSNLMGNMFLIPILGTKGAAISTGISYILFFTLRTFFSNKLYYVDFKLKKFYSFTFYLCIYSLYNTFYRFDAVSFLAYLVGVSLLFLLYRPVIYEGIGYIKLVLNQFFKRTS